MAARIPNARLRTALAALAALLALNACSSTGEEPHSPDPLLIGSRAPIPRAQLNRATAAAHRFGSAYARSIYRAQPPPLPGATPQVTATLRTAAARVPPDRRDLHPRAGQLRLDPESATRAHAALTILDGRSPPFTVGFDLTRRGPAWRITAISPPG